MGGMFDEQESVALDMVSYKPGDRMGCGWGLMERGDELCLVKVLLHKRDVERLQEEFDNGFRPSVRVWPWQIRLTIPHGEDLYDV